MLFVDGFAGTVFAEDLMRDNDATSSDEDDEGLTRIVRPSATDLVDLRFR